MTEKKVITKEWKLEEISLLIQLVKGKPELYNQSKPGYLNAVVLEKCWQGIADAIESKDVQLCKSKWQILRGCYRTRRSGGKGSKKWPYYESLSFLDNYIGHRKSLVKLETPNHFDDDYVETVILTTSTDGEEYTSDAVDSATEFYTPSLGRNKRRSPSPLELDDELIHHYNSKKSKSSIHLFFQSMEEDVAKLSPKGLRNFKKDMLQTLDKYLEIEGKDKL